MHKFRQLFNKKCSIIGMIHVEALPGTPKYCGSIEKILNNALKDAEIYKSCGVDGILIENMHDIPYIRSNELMPETTAVMTRLCTEIRKELPITIPCGIQILAAGNKEAVAVAKAAGFQYIRAEGYIFSHIADEGFIDGCAGSLLRYRKQIDAEDILIFTDIKKKHSSHAITADISLKETVRAAEFFLTDGIILTGNSTGDPANADELKEVKKFSKVPVLIGSGVTIDNVKYYLDADALIIGTHFKINSKWENSVDKCAVNNFMQNLNH